MDKTVQPVHQPFYKQIFVRVQDQCVITNHNHISLHC